MAHHILTAPRLIMPRDRQDAGLGYHDDVTILREPQASQPRDAALDWGAREARGCKPAVAAGRSNGC